LRKKRWAEFQPDVEWHAVEEETEKDGPLGQDISNTLLKPTASSAAR
jgi:hypothetical protein